MDPTSRIDPTAAAIVVIDVQNDFCHPDGRQARQGQDVQRVQTTVDRIAGLVAAARAVSVPVVWVWTTHAAQTDTPEWLARHDDPAREQSCQAGSWGAEFYQVAPAPGEVLVEKHRYSGFTRTTLDDELSALGRRSLLFCGVTSNTCVESTLRDAVCLDYRATFVDDCCGAYTQAAHDRAVQSVRSGFGAVLDSAAVIAHWMQQPAPSAAGR